MHTRVSHFNGTDTTGVLHAAVIVLRFCCDNIRRELKLWQQNAHTDVLSTLQSTSPNAFQSQACDSPDALPLTFVGLPLLSPNSPHRLPLGTSIHRRETWFEVTSWINAHRPTHTQLWPSSLLAQCLSVLSMTMPFPCLNARPPPPPSPHTPPPCRGSYQAPFPHTTCCTCPPSCLFPAHNYSNYKWFCSSVSTSPLDGCSIFPCILLPKIKFRT